MTTQNHLSPSPIQQEVCLERMRVGADQAVENFKRAIEAGKCLDDSGRLCGISKRISQRSLTEDIEFVDLEDTNVRD